MKKILLFVLSISILMTACGANPSEEKDNEEENSFKATIIEVHDGTILVEPLKGEDVLKSADRISVSGRGIDFPENLKEGDIVEVIYTGGVMESYPAQINSAISIEAISNY